MFESVDEVEQIDAEPKGNEVKLLSKVSNGSDSGHPSSRNISVASGLSDSPSTEDSGVQEMSTKTSTLENVMQDHRKEENKKEKMEKTVMACAAGKSEKAEMEDMDTVEELQVSEKNNEVDVGEHSEVGEGFEGIVPQGNQSGNLKATKVEDKKRRTEVLDEAEETKQEEKSGLLIPVSKGEKSEECVGTGTETGSQGLNTTYSEILNTSASIKTDESVKIQASKHPAGAHSSSLVKENIQAEAVRKKVMMPSAPVVKEIVVPVVFEAFSTREMSKETPATDSDESPSAIEMEEIPVARLVGVQGASEIETLYPQYESHAVASEKNATTSVPPTGTIYSVHVLFIGINVCDTKI